LHNLPAGFACGGEITLQETVVCRSQSRGGLKLIELFARRKCLADYRLEPTPPSSMKRLSARRTAPS
jgi:hypothetical protein